jgi:hypothetical protein
MPQQRRGLAGFQISRVHPPPTPPPPPPRGVAGGVRSCAFIVPIIWPISRLAGIVSPKRPNHGTRLTASARSKRPGAWRCRLGCNAPRGGL